MIHDFEIIVLYKIFYKCPRTNIIPKQCKYSLDDQDDMMTNEYVSVLMAARYNNIELKIIIHIYLYIYDLSYYKTPNGHYIYKQYIKSLLILIFLNYNFFIWLEYVLASLQKTVNWSKFVDLDQHVQKTLRLVKSGIYI